MTNKRLGKLVYCGTAIRIWIINPITMIDPEHWRIRANECNQPGPEEEIGSTPISNEAPKWTFNFRKAELDYATKIKPLKPEFVYPLVAPVIF